MLDLIDLFPKTIAVSKLQSLTPEIIEKAIEFIDLSGNVDLGTDGAYTREQQILDKAIFKDVKQEVIGLCKEFAGVYSHAVEDIGICNSWGNVVTFGKSIRYHRHDNSYISGAFHLTKGSPFNILNSMHGGLFGGFMPEVTDKENFRSWDSFNIPPEPGRVVLFPSGLHHCVLPSDGHEKRYSIAFNAIPLGRIGAPTGMMNIRLG